MTEKLPSTGLGLAAGTDRRVSSLISLHRGLRSLREIFTTQAYSLTWLSLPAEDHLAEADAGHGEIDDADGEHRDERTPHKGDVGATEQHSLSELHEMRRRADRLNKILQPDRHALHRRAAA